MSYEHLSDDELAELVAIKEQLFTLDKRNKLALQDFTNYTKHLEFFERGATHKFRLFLAANRAGKSYSGGVEFAYHVTGLYPSWWRGYRFKFSNNWWVCGVDANTVRRELQTLLLGAVGDLGTGLIPYDCIDFSTLKDAKKADTPISDVRIMHVSGTYSSISFKSYESGREAFQAASVNVWLDEEPPESVYTECLLRTVDTHNNPNLDRLMLFMTFTPLKGMTKTIETFMGNDPYFEGEVPDESGYPSKWVTRATWDDAPHLSEKTKATMLAAIPDWARDARSKGIPTSGTGTIYPFRWDDVSVPRFEIPAHWKRYAGMDTGNRTGVLWLAIDPSTGRHYAYDEYYQENVHPNQHINAISLRGLYVPIAIDTASHAANPTDQQNLFSIYLDGGLDVTNANKAVEAGLFKVWGELQQGTLKFFNDLTKLKREFQTYAKDEKGNVIKKNDELCFTGDTLVTTPSGRVPIASLVGTTGKVLTPFGFRDYTACAQTGTNQPVVRVTTANGFVDCTPNHLFLTPSGWVRADSLSGCSVINTELTGEPTWTQRFTAQQNNPLTDWFTTSRGSTTSTTLSLGTSLKNLVQRCTERFGFTTTGPSPLSTTFTILMKIATIINRQTLLACRPLTMLHFMADSGCLKEQDQTMRA